MTHEDVEETMEGAREEAPPGHYWSTIKGRRVLVANLNPAQAMALGGIMRRAKSADFDLNMDLLGKLMALFETLIVDADDRDWLENGILTNQVAIEDFAHIFIGHADGGQQKPKKPRRGR